MDMLRAYVEMRPLADNSFPLQTKIDQFSDTANETVDASEAYILGSHDGAVRSDSDNKPRGQHELDPVSIQQVSVRTREHVGKNGNIILDLPELIERGIPLPISDISALGSKVCSNRLFPLCCADLRRLSTHHRYTCSHFLLKAFEAI